MTSDLEHEAIPVVRTDLSLTRQKLGIFPDLLRLNQHINSPFDALVYIAWNFQYMFLVILKAFLVLLGNGNKMNISLFLKILWFMGKKGA